MNNYANALANNEYYNEAVNVRRELVALEKAKYANAAGHMPNELFQAMASLADLYATVLNYDAALELGNEILQRLKTEYRGQRVAFKNSLERLVVQFGWQSPVEIDVAAFLLGIDDEVRGDDDIVFFNQPSHASGGVEFSDGDCPSFSIDLSKIPHDIKTIALTLSLDASARAATFKLVRDVRVCVIDEIARKELFRFESGEECANMNAIVLGEIYRHKNQWKFRAISSGFIGGLEFLCKHFGVDVD